MPLQYKNILDALLNPKTTALVSTSLVLFLFCLQLLIPSTATLEQAQLWSTLTIVASLGYMAITAIYALHTVVHTYLLFIGCISLFIGGRFIAYAMGFDVSILGMEKHIFAIHRPGFITLDLAAAEGLRLAIYLAICLHAMHAGYMACLTRLPKAKPQTGTPDWTLYLKIPAIVLACLSAAVFAASFPDVYKSVHSDGYVAMYKGSTDFTTRGSSAAQYGLLLALGLSFAAQSRRLVFAVLGILAIYYIASLQLGVRGGVVGFALLCVWLYHTQVKRIDRLALILVPAALIIPIGLATLGPRAGDFGEGVNVYIPWFIDNQGMTALYVNAAMQITHYPPLAYLHSILPVAPTIASLHGDSVTLEQLYFGQYLSKSFLSGDAYQQGFGLGWSLFADFYVYTLWVPGLYALAAAGFGAALAWFVRSDAPIVLGAHAMIFSKIMLLPRTGLYSIIPYLVAYAAIVASVYVASQLLQRKMGRASPG